MLWKVFEGLRISITQFPKMFLRLNEHNLIKRKKPKDVQKLLIRFRNRKFSLNLNKIKQIRTRNNLIILDTLAYKITV